MKFLERAVYDMPITVIQAGPEELTKAFRRMNP